MKCPYQDIACWYIDDHTHNCEARSSIDCPHVTDEDLDVMNLRSKLET